MKRSKKQLKPERTEPKVAERKSVMGIQSAHIKSTLVSPGEENWRKAFIILFSVVCILMAWLSFYTGINGDEDVQVPYAERLIDFYTTFGKDTSAFQSTKGDVIRYYGGGYEIIAALTTRTLGLEEEDVLYHDIRHLLVAVFGMLGIFFVGRTARYMGGWRAGFFAVLMMLFSLRFVGEALWNNKDIPFAVGYIIATCFTVRLLQQLPELKWKTLAGLALGIALATSVRAGGILSIAYLGLFLLLHLQFYGGGFQALARKSVFIRYLKAGLIPAAGGMLVAILLWPYALLNPIKHISEALSTFQHFPVSIRELFDGKLILSSEVPYTYLFTWIGITTPLYFLTGLALLIPLFIPLIKRYNWLLILFLAFAFIFPVLYVMQQESSLHQGWRHFYFVYGPGLLVSLFVWDTLYLKFERIRVMAIVIPVTLGLMLAEPAYQFARNATMPHMYFNPLVGGPQGAYAKYEFDYQGVTTAHAIRWMMREGILHKNMTEPVTITTNFYYNVKMVIPRDIREHVNVTYSRYRQRYHTAWDYGVFVNRYMEGSYLENTWPNSKSIHNVEYHGVPVSTIYHNTTTRANDAWEAMNSAQIPLADSLLQAELAAHPDDALLWEMLVNVAYQRGDMDRAITALNTCLEAEPLNMVCLNYGAFIYSQRGDLGMMEHYARRGLQAYEMNPMAHYQLGIVEMERGNYQQALQHAEMAIALNPNERDSYVLAAEIFERMGMPDRARQVRAMIQNR